MNRILCITIILIGRLCFPELFCQAPTFHIVQKGENIDSIAKKYNITVDQLIEANPDLISHPLSPKQLLIIPSGSLQSKKETPTQRTGQYSFHIVKEKETLYGIAKQYNTTPEYLIALDPVHNKKELRPGDTVVLSLPTTTYYTPKISAIDSASYIFHKVSKGETLFSLASKYHISKEKIIEANPHLETTSLLRENDIIRIPIRELIKNNPETTRPSPPQQNIHIVKRGETPYSIARKYNIPLTKLTALNPSIEKGIREGDQLLLPDILPPATDQLPDHTLDVLILCPFENALTQQYLATLPADQPATIHPKAQIAYDFYLGCMVALDSLAKLSLPLPIRVTFRDEQPDSISRQTWIEEVTRYDLIIGPFYTENVEKTIQRLRNTSIPVITPFIEDNKILTTSAYPYLYKWNSSAAAKTSFMASYLAQTIRNKNLVLVKTDPKDSLLSKIFLREWKINRASKMPPEVLIRYAGHKNIDPYLSTNDTTYIVLFPGNQVVFSEMINYLSGLNYKEKRYIITYTTDPIFKFDNLDWEHLNVLNLHIISSFYIAHPHTTTLPAYQHAIRNYNIMMNKYSWVGYEITFSAIRHIAQLSLPTEVKITSPIHDRSLLFKPLGYETGKENFSPMLFELKNYLFYPKNSSTN